MENIIDVRDTKFFLLLKLRINPTNERIKSGKTIIITKTPVGSDANTGKEVSNKSNSSLLLFISFSKVYD
jgi:hypothetical protein